MDDKLTQKVQQWLETPASERDIQAGATLMLQLNRNRILFNNIMRKPEKFLGKLEYELKKHLRIRLDGLTLREVALMEREVLPSVQAQIAAGAPTEPDSGEEQPKNYIGRRADHDTLPEEIQALYVRNGEVFAKLKETFETLKQMEKAPACDRYEHLVLLRELDEEYRGNWAKYDHFGEEGAGIAGSEAPMGVSANVVTAARKYLSANKTKLGTLIEAADDKALALREKMQQRIDAILSSGGSFDADYQQALQELGLSFG